MPIVTVARGLAEELSSLLKPRPKQEVPEAERLRVHATISRFSVLYERIRNAVDYKDEHLLRKAGILRILRRHLILDNDPKSIASHLVRELIGARYLPNGELPESLIVAVSIPIAKYLAVSGTRSGSDQHYSWLQGIVSAEIEELVLDASREKGIVTFLYERLAPRVRITGITMAETEVRLQVYLACYRGLYKADDDILGYKLLRAYMPEWLRADEWLSSPTATAERLVGVERRIRQTLRHPQGPRFQRHLKPWHVSMTLLVQAMEAAPKGDTNELLRTPAVLEAVIGKRAESQYQVARAKLRRGAWRAIVYLFVTKMVIALVLEVPIESTFYQHVYIPSLLTNLLFPPILMFIVSLFIHVPGKDNTARIIDCVGLLLTDSVPQVEIRVPAKRGGMARVMFSLVYAFTFLLTFGAIAFVLQALTFTWVSALIFIFFLCVVSFFAFRLRSTAREFVVIESSQRVSSVLIDLVSLPILRAGQWLSQSISRLNVFLFFFDFLFEAPYKLFLSVLEEWFAFMKEKKEELQ